MGTGGALGCPVAGATPRRRLPGETQRRGRPERLAENPIGPIRFPLPGSLFVAGARCRMSMGIDVDMTHVG